MLTPPITLLPSLPTNLTEMYTLAALEAKVFFDEDFSALAFGPERASEKNIQKRADLLTKSATTMDIRYVKAVMGDEIVAFAAWNFKEGRKEGDGWEGHEVEEGGDSPWTGGNSKFCEDVFLTADKDMERACGGRDYGKLNILVVSPKCQRRGIGTMLLEEGLKVVDERGLQCILGASKQGRGLYKKVGFEDFAIRVLDLEKYEGGEGMKQDEHVVMWRSSRSK